MKKRLLKIANVLGDVLALLTNIIIELFASGLGFICHAVYLLNDEQVLWAGLNALVGCAVHITRSIDKLKKDLVNVHERILDWEKRNYGSEDDW